jgi:hypothetical protein
MHTGWVDADLTLEELGLRLWVAVHGPVTAECIYEMFPDCPTEIVSRLEHDQPMDLMSPPKKKRPKVKAERKKSQDQIDRAVLESHFSEITGIAKPEPKTARQRSQAVALWWSPLRDIYEMTGRDVEAAQTLITEAVWRMAELTIASPKSIEKVCISINAKEGHDDLVF